MTSRFAPALAALVTLSTLAAGCAGSARGGSSAASGATGDVAITGRAVYDRPVVDPVGATLSPVTTRAAIRHARVLVTAHGAVVAAGATDADGRFAVRVPAAFDGAPLAVRVEARAALEWAPVVVADHAGAVHVLASASPVTSAAPVDLVASPLPADGRLAGAFNLLDAALRGLELARAAEPGLRLPPLDVVWTPGGPNRATTSFDRTRMTLDVLDDPGVDTDCFDDSVVLHELGHYLQTACSSDSTPGGTHLSCAAATPQDLDPRLAFAEGWATAFGQAVLGDPRYVDTRAAGGLVVDLERPCTRALGVGSESAIHGVLWDLLDGAGGLATSDADGAALGFAPLWLALRALRGTPHASVRDLRAALLAGGGLDARGWDLVAAPLGLAAPLPDLGLALPGVAQVQDVVNAALGQDSLRAASRYYLVTVPGPAALLSITLAPSDPARDELDLLVDGADGARFASRADAAAERLDLVAPAAGVVLVRVQARAGAPGSPTAAFTLAVTLR